MELDATFGSEDSDSEAHEVVADRRVVDPEEALVFADRREKQLARLSPRARKFVELLESPPQCLVDLVKGLQARREFAIQRGLTSPGAPKRVQAALIFRFMGCSRAEQTKIVKELESKFNLKAAFAEMDRVD